MQDLQLKFNEIFCRWACLASFVSLKKKWIFCLSETLGEGPEHKTEIKELKKLVTNCSERRIKRCILEYEQLVFSVYFKLKKIWYSYEKVLNTKCSGWSPNCNFYSIFLKTDTIFLCFKNKSGKWNRSSSAVCPGVQLICSGFSSISN